MRNHVTSLIGRIMAQAFYKIGNNLNVSNVLKLNNYNKGKQITNDRDALMQDWTSVGKEVKLAIDKFEKTYRVNGKTKFESRFT